MKMPTKSKPATAPVAVESDPLALITQMLGSITDRLTALESKPAAATVEVVSNGQHPKPRGRKPSGAIDWDAENGKWIMEATTAAAPKPASTKGTVPALALTIAEGFALTRKHMQKFPAGEFPAETIVRNSVFKSLTYLVARLGANSDDLIWDVASSKAGEKSGLSQRDHMARNCAKLAADLRK